MNLKLVILPEAPDGSTISKLKNNLLEEMGEITNKPIEVIYDIESIKFDQEECKRQNPKNLHNYVYIGCM